ncbi:MAG: IS3 family transposase [Actinobacteria bacterium]|nr:IS3 family transposase [Actinomycetota bacterium]MBU1492776.1 IS3 family transposase [Actinomycetota bacterium]
MSSIRFETRKEAKLYLFEYIEIFYNRQRHQTRLGHRTPVEYAAGFTS